MAGMADNFVPFSGNRPTPFQNVLPTNVNPCAPLSGHGSPEGVVAGNPGMRWLDIDTGDFWVKFAGTQAIGWRQQGAAASGGVQVIG